MRLADRHATQAVAGPLGGFVASKRGRHNFRRPTRREVGETLGAHSAQRIVTPAPPSSSKYLSDRTAVSRGHERASKRLLDRRAQFARSDLGNQFRYAWRQTIGAHPIIAHIAAARWLLMVLIVLPLNRSVAAENRLFVQKPWGNSDRFDFHPSQIPTSLTAKADSSNNRPPG